MYLMLLVDWGDIIKLAAESEEPVICSRASGALMHGVPSRDADVEKVSRRPLLLSALRWTGVSRKFWCNLGHSLPR